MEHVGSSSYQLLRTEGRWKIEFYEQCPLVLSLESIQRNSVSFWKAIEYATHSNISKDGIQQGEKLGRHCTRQTISWPFIGNSS